MAIHGCGKLILQQFHRTKERFHMAQWYRGSVIVPHDNGLPKDSIQNTFAFMVSGSGDRDLIAFDFQVRLEDFYNDWTTFRSSQYEWASARFQVIDMLDDQPRIPFYDVEMSIDEAATTVNDLPAEVAVVLSFEGERASGVNMRRRRGRVYCGPLQVGSADQHEVQSGVVSAIVTAAGDHLLNPADPIATWAIYSPYTHHGIAVGDKLTPEDPEVPDFLPASFEPVVRCWVDNAWDTQRRRGPAASSRTIIVSS